MMLGNLNEILPEPISDESQEIILELLKRKMTGSAQVAVRLLHAMEERFGSEARDVMREMVASPPATPRQNVGDPVSDLQEFITDLERGCVGSHRWERITDEPDRIGYLFFGCLWAEIYRELGEPELGFAFCATDEPNVKAHSPALGFTRTEVLMNGDEACNHVFFVER
jgi:hypothetical protein